MLESPELLVSGTDHKRICDHYYAAGPLLDKHFHGTPLIAVTYPRGLGHDPVFHKALPNGPKTIATVSVRTSTGEHPYVAMNLHNLTWLTRGRFAVEFEGWSPAPENPQRAAFGRLTLEPNGRSGEPQAYAAAHTILAALAALGLDAIPILDGVRGIALWIPFDDGPAYDDLAKWLRVFAKQIAAQNANLLTTEHFIADRGDRVSIGTRSNHPGMGSMFPYSLRGTESLEVAVPCPASELGGRRNGDVTAETFAAHIKKRGDEFAELRHAIREQRFVDLVPVAQDLGETSPELVALALTPRDPRGLLIGAAETILADGKPRTSEAILREASERGLLPHSTTAKHIYTALHEYILRTLGAGRTPELVQLPGTSEFRINRPADDWPDVALPPLPHWQTRETIAAAVGRLRTTATGADPTAFERAACEAFGALGLLAEHLGGNGEADGILTAPLGTDGYRIVLECKTASPGGIVNNPRPEEAAKFRAHCNARYSILLGPAFGAQGSFEDELQQHQVALWTVNDLVTALEQQISPDDLRSTLAPGRAEKAIGAILWERDHGRRKRVEVIAQRIESLGWQTQVTLARGVPLAETPPLTQETLFILADESLVNEGVVTGATRSEAEEALRILLARDRLRATGDGYVVRTPQSSHSTAV